jgi:hypothetical protein
MNKWVVIAIIAVVLIAGGALVFAMKGKTTTVMASPTAKPKLSLPINAIPVSDRPFVEVKPTAAREVTIVVGKLKKQSDSVDFELEYSSAAADQAAIGSLMLTGSGPFTKTVLLGSESAGGRITYNEGVTGGTLTLTFYNENYKLANQWAYFDNRKPGNGQFNSQDGKFEIDTAKLFKSQPFEIVYNNPGLPGTTDKTLLAGPYSIAGTDALPTGKVTITMHLSDAKPATIMGWTGSDWKELATTTNGQTATATNVDLLPTYIAVAK